MELIKTKHYGTPLDVIFDGRYFFFDAFHGLVAYIDYPEKNEDDMTVTYPVEFTSAIDKFTIERVIKKTRSDFIKRLGLLDEYKVQFKYTLHREVSALPYHLDINLKKLN